jgi:uncharacterized protein YndB with AHSA1/START domain
MSQAPKSVGPGDRARVTVFVAVSPEDAFEVFTREIDLWWKHGPKYRIAGRRRGKLYFEPGLGGRLFETFELSAGSRTIEVGTVTSWNPPERISLEWRGVNFKPGEKTFVDVEFQPSQEGTLVTVSHHGWSALPDDHPVRHGEVGAAFSRRIGLWWGELMTSFREYSTFERRTP